MSMDAQPNVVQEPRHPVILSSRHLAVVAQTAHEWYGEMDEAVAARVIWQLGRAESAPLTLVLLSLAEATALMHACSWALAELTAGDRMEPHDLEHRRLIAEGLAALAQVGP
jgi:hypothetical protein